MVDVKIPVRSSHPDRDSCPSDRIPHRGIPGYDVARAQTYSAAEAACPEERIRWMRSIGLLSPDEGRLTFGSVLAVKMTSALLDTGSRPSRSSAQPPKGCSRLPASSSTWIRG
jgi:hypothetical protein